MDFSGAFNKNKKIRPVQTEKLAKFDRDDSKH